METVPDSRAAGETILRDRTTIANSFVRLYTSGHDGRSPRRRVSQVSYQLALDTIERLGQALVDGTDTIEAPPLRGARAALRGKHMAQSLDWIGHLERLVTNYLYADSGLAVDRAKAGVLRLAQLFDAIYRQELDAYRKVQDQLSGWQSRVGTGLVTYLLSGAPIETAALDEQARMLGIDPNQPFRAAGFCHVARHSVDTERWARIRARILEALWRHDERREVLVLDRRALMLVVAPEDRPGAGILALVGGVLAERDLVDDVVAASAVPDPSLIAAGTGLRSAVATLEICLHRGLRGRVVVESEVALDVLLTQNEAAARLLVANSLGCLVDRSTLLETLRAYIACDLALQRTAEVLFVHPNTVVYRLRQIAELTGRDMRSIDALAAFSNGLVALDILEIHKGRRAGHQDLRAAVLTGD